MRLRALSPLLATIILIAIVLSAGLVVYGMLSGWIGTYSSTLSIQPTSVDLVVAGDKALLSVCVKNTGNKPLAGVVVTGYDDNGKPFKLALSPAEPGQASGNTLVIPLGVPNIVLDASGNNNHGTIYGATWTTGKNGKALLFDGASNYVACLYSPLISGDRTWMSWIYPQTGTDPMTFYEEGVTGAGQMFYVYVSAPNTGRLAVDCWARGWYSSNPRVTINQWNHAVFTYSGTTKNGKFFINGVFDVETPAFTGTGFFDVNDLYVGGDPMGASGNYYRGIIDEVCVYRTQLSGQEILFSSSNPGLPVTRGLVLWLPLDEGINNPYSFTAGSSYALTITAYSLDGSVATQTAVVRAMT